MATSTKQRLRYIDSSGTEQIIGEINGAGDEKGLSRGQVFHRGKEYDKAVVRGDVTLKQKLPQDNTEFQGDPEIFFETYDPSTDSWTTRFRGYLLNGGLIDRNNEIKALLFDMVKYHGDEKATVEITGATTNVDVMKEIAPSNVVIDHPTETEVQNNSDQDGFVDYDGYSMVGEPRKRVIYEQTQVPGWVLKPTADQDGSGNWIWRYEPIGYGGTVDTIKDSSVPASVSGSLGIIREWGFTRKKNIINEVELINTENGSKVVGSYSASSESSPNSVDKYGERYESYQVGFLSSTQANTLAQKIVDRNKQAQEGGNLKASPRYEGNEANNSFEVRSEEKDIDGVFYATEQINHYPEASTDFTFTFERESEAEAAAAENLRSERRKLYPSTGKGLSGQTGSTSPDVNGDTGETGPDVAGQTGDTQPNVAGTSDTNMSDAGNTNPLDLSSTLSNGDTFSDTQDVNFLSGDAPIIFVYFQVQARADNSTFVGGEVTITNTTKNVTLHQDSVSTSYQPGDSRLYMAVEAGDGDLEGDTIEFKYDATANSGTMRFSYGIMSLGDHDHGSGSYDADLHPHSDGSLDADNHPHTDGTLDTDNHPHDTGTLQADTYEEDKTDRT